MDLLPYHSKFEPLRIVVDYAQKSSFEKNAFKVFDAFFAYCDLKRSFRVAYKASMDADFNNLSSSMPKIRQNRLIIKLFDFLWMVHSNANAPLLSL